MRAVVIGAGVVGMLSALALRERGYHVTVLDMATARPPASWAGGGILSALFPWRYPAPLTALTQDAVPRYTQLAARILAAGGPDPEVYTCGMLVDAGGEHDAALAWAARHGKPADYRSASQVAPVLPDAPWIWLPEVGTVRNSRLLKGLHCLLAREGVSRAPSAAVSAIVPEQGAWRVSSAEGAIMTDQVLIAAGAWSAELLADAGLQLGLQPVQGEMLLYPPGLAPPPCVLLSDAGYVIPRRDGHVLAGSTLRHGSQDQRPTAGAAQQLRAMAETLWPPLKDTTPVAHWAGIRPGSARQWPWLGEVPDAPGLFLATGHYRNGLVSAPASAELIACLMAGKRPSIDPRPYALSSALSAPSSSSSPP
ncbi:FAD-dependent oxidoreductase [Alcanivorax sp. JB21]|uniref:NAD(P)/FAD-dependent oxidoreductase n=1 Tax=Alcanivorax limicola TaxID=2874102 RepID=UPI001CC16D6B|nr:FAD-dependent oxidoreductase [Alcanivorax limicola]MBZ2190527.1 FAD-dependent oxidoreductase [Alcanivorax limicola]